VLEFRPSVIAVSALWCSLDELHPSTFDAYLTSLTRHFNQSQKVKIWKRKKKKNSN